MSILKEKAIVGAGASKTSDQPENADRAKRLASLEKLKGKMRPEVFESFKNGVKRFDKLYQLLAK